MAGARVTVRRTLSGSMRAVPPMLASIWGAVITVGGFTAAAKVASLLKDSMVAAQFGNGARLDAFLLALALPAFLVNVAAGTVPAALTPQYVLLREREGPGAARALAARVLRSVYRSLALLACVGAVASLGYGLLPGAGLAPATRAMLPWLALTLAPYTLLQGVCASWSGLLAAEHDYVTSAAAPALQPAGMVGAMLLGGADPTIGMLVAGLLGGTLLQGAVLAHALRRKGIRLWHPSRATTEGVDRAVGQVRMQYLPAVAGAVLMSATTIIDQTMAAWLPPGSVSALGYGTKLSALMMSIGSVALSTTLLPHLSRLVAREEWPAIRRLLARVATVILAITIPTTIAAIALSTPVVRLLYERGAFTSAETALVSQVQAAYMLQLPVHLLGILYVRLISALGSNRLLTVGAAVSLVVNVVLNVVLMRRLGVAGIALSTACVYLVSCVFLCIASHRALMHAELEWRRRRPDSSQVPTHLLDTEERCASAA